MQQRIQKLSIRAQAAVSSLAVIAICVTAGAGPGLAQQSFPSAAEASQNLFQAVQQSNLQAIANILGGRTELASSSDEAQDKVERQLFVQKYQEMHRLGRETDGSMTLYIGAENWPFPIPLVQNNGAWRFDADNGMKEVLFRRIGENELSAIAICHEFVAAEKHRPQTDSANPANSFTVSLVAKAGDKSGSNNAALFQGYNFRVLATSSGFALIAYPAEYRSSGVMTFVVTGSDVVYEKDLGANTSTAATAMTTFRKDATWRAAGE
jgi:hypothetical protein